MYQNIAFLWRAGGAAHVKTYKINLNIYTRFRYTRLSGLQEIHTLSVTFLISHVTFHVMGSNAPAGEEHQKNGSIKEMPLNLSYAFYNSCF